MCCKGNAYGHGVTEIVSMAYKTGLPTSPFWCRRSENR
jgi:alanine racemase